MEYLEIPMSGVQVAQCLETLVQAYGEFIRIGAEEATKRRQIDAWEHVQISKIASTRDILVHHLDRSFDERRENFTSLFRSLDNAIEQNQTEFATDVLASIVDLAKTSPFKDIRTEVRQFLADPSAEMEVEF